MYRSPFRASARAVGSVYLQKGSMWISGHHTGEDWYCDADKTVVAPASGTVQRNRWDKSYGNYIVIQTEDGKVLLMAHMESKALPAEGSRITAGSQVGIMGTTGNSTGVHLHIEVENAAEWAYDSNLLRPSEYIDFNNYSAQAPANGYKLGDNVVFSTCYRSSDAPVEQAIAAKDMLRNHGVITRILAGAQNPYLLDEDLCWVNGGDIRGYYTGVNRMAVVSTKEKDLNIRSGASLDASVLGSMPKGSSVEIIGEDGDWYQIRYGKLTGYASKQYIK